MPRPSTLARNDRIRSDFAVVYGRIRNYDAALQQVADSWGLGLRTVRSIVECWPSAYPDRNPPKS